MPTNLNTQVSSFNQLASRGITFTRQSITMNKTPEMPWYGDIRLFRNRIIAGLFVVLPFFITYGIVKWLYEVLYNYAIGPIASILREYSTLKDSDAPLYVVDVVSSLMAFIIVLAILYVAGIFARTRLHNFVDWVLMTVPGVNTVHRVVSNVFGAISNSRDTGNFKRVVLVEFPHPGMKVPAFVTSECTDESSGKNILCVYVPTTPVPSSGYMLMVPESDVTPISWDLEVTLQAIVSGGLTVPDSVSYYKDGEGPIRIEPKRRV